MKKRIMSGFVGLVVACMALSACGTEAAQGSEVPPETTTASAETTAPEDASLSIARRGEKSEYDIVFTFYTDGDNFFAARLKKAFSEYLGVTVDMQTGHQQAKERPYEILLGAAEREESAAVMDTLRDGEYAIETVVTEEGVKIVIAYKGEYARLCAIDRFIKEYIHEETGLCEVPADLNVKGTCQMKDALVSVGIDRLRDPSVLVVDGTYYAYGTGWECYKNTLTRTELYDTWTQVPNIVVEPGDVAGDRWAPEVHLYNGAYYMFTTYRSTKTGHRGCTVFKSDSPEGPFVNISNGHITPTDRDAIDGTLYVDPDGQPWMIYVGEWTGTDDGIGRMMAAKLSNDLSRFVSTPIELFRADDASWCRSQVTDGCWMYRTEDGQLLMLWSSSDDYGYCVGIARSVSGKVEGPWTHDKELLYSKWMTAKYDGGHGMLFTAPDGQLYLSIHSPNAAQGTRKEKPVFIPVREEKGTLVWDVWRGEEET